MGSHAQVTPCLWHVPCDSSQPAFPSNLSLLCCKNNKGKKHPACSLQCVCQQVLHGTGLTSISFLSIQGENENSVFLLCFLKHWGQLKPTPLEKSTQQTVLVGPSGWQTEAAPWRLPPSLQSPTGTTVLLWVERPAKASCNWKCNHHPPKTQLPDQM